MEKRELSCTVGGNVNWYSYYGEHYGGSFKKKLKLPYDSAILGLYLEDILILKDTCTIIFTTALLPIVKSRKQPKSKCHKSGLKIAERDL